MGFNGESLADRTIDPGTKYTGRPVDGAKVRLDEWSEFIDECGKFEAEIDKEFAKRKFTLAELEEEEQSVERLRRWLAMLEGRDVLHLDAASTGAERLAVCERRLGEYAEAVYAHTSRPAEGAEA